MSTLHNPAEEQVDILIAEDSPTQAGRLRLLLERHRYRVKVANNGRQALSLMLDYTPTLVITDILMPEMNGFELCKAIKANERTRDIPVMLLTSLSNAEDVLEGLTSGADSFITKPYSENYLLANVQQILANRHLGRNGRVRIGVQIRFGEKELFVTADHQQMLTLLISTYEAAIHRNAELIQSQRELSDLNERLEDLVQERTASLMAEIAERKRAEAEREKLEAQFLQAQKLEAVGRLAGGMAHDFNNMLGVISGYAELSLLSVEPSDPLFGNLREIKDAVERSADIVRQLLAFARKQTIMPKLLNLNDTVANTLKMLKRLIGEDIDLLWKPAADLWAVSMDPTQVDQILANLVVNARDAISGVGKITIETGSAEFDEAYCALHADYIVGKYVLLAVSDDGCGMDQETVAQSFEPFFTTKPPGRGTGLGLSTVYGIVKQNHGFINVYSEQGKGTSFRSYLPAHALDDIALEEAPSPSESATGTETVLLVEDEGALLRLSHAMLEQLGYTVLAASTPTQAMRLAEELPGRIHLLLTDVVMPEMNGRDLWERLSKLRPEMKCLFMSGYTANAIAHHGILDLGVHYVQKPFSSAALAAKIRDVLSR